MAPAGEGPDMCSGDLCVAVRFGADGLALQMTASGLGGLHAAYVSSMYKAPRGCQHAPVVLLLMQHAAGVLLAECPGDDPP